MKLVLSCLAALSLPAAHDLSASPLAGRRIAFIGDSYVRNHRNAVEDTWHYKLAAKHGMEYHNYGRNGGCIAFDRAKFGPSILKRFGEMEDGLDYVVMIAGHNDAGFIQKGDGKNSVSPERQAENFTTFTNGLDRLCTGLRAKYPSATIVFISPWRVERAYFSEVMEAERAAAARHGFAFFDAAHLSGVNPNDPEERKAWFQGPNDTAHLNPKGHDRVLPVFEKFFLSLAPAKVDD